MNATDVVVLRAAVKSETHKHKVFELAMCRKDEVSRLIKVGQRHPSDQKTYHLSLSLCCFPR